MTRYLIHAWSQSDETVLHLFWTGEGWSTDYADRLTVEFDDPFSDAALAYGQDAAQTLPGDAAIDTVNYWQDADLAEFLFTLNRPMFLFNIEPDIDAGTSPAFVFQLGPEQYVFRIVYDEHGTPSPTLMRFDDQRLVGVLL